MHYRVLSFSKHDLTSCYLTEIVQSTFLIFIDLIFGFKYMEERVDINQVCVFKIFQFVLSFYPQKLLNGAFRSSWTPLVFNFGFC